MKKAKVKIWQKNRPNNPIFFDSVIALQSEMFLIEQVSESWLEICLKNKLFFVFKGVLCFGEFVEPAGTEGE